MSQQRCYAGGLVLKKQNHTTNHFLVGGKINWWVSVNVICFSRLFQRKLIFAVLDGNKDEKV